MKYRIGEEVKIKSKEDILLSPSSTVCFTKSMWKFCRKIGIIKCIYLNDGFKNRYIYYNRYLRKNETILSYRIEFKDGEDWSFVEGWISKLIIKNINLKLMKNKIIKYDKN